MALQSQFSDSTTRDVLENNLECQWVKSLNEEIYNAICTLLRRQSLRGLQEFKESVQQFVDQGYPLTIDQPCRRTALHTRIWINQDFGMQGPYHNWSQRQKPMTETNITMRAMAHTLARSYYRPPSQNEFARIESMATELAKGFLAGSPTDCDGGITRTKGASIMTMNNLPGAVHLGRCAGPPIASFIGGWHKAVGRLRSWPRSSHQLSWTWEGEPAD